ncbi:ATP-binding cassette domain-containing protein [Kocuria sp. JC486]|uniref:ABC-type quaternary amine transporter n=1 Tax=Kocuria soli TaxID=2485125 RepID=A0A3N4A212_9MICC|nr:MULTISPECIES: ATP-binding cassette domain-containing protein [Kocuria]NHU85578.1 ATP-binding cassette domain-containing protein [Kocuria sp. JC486]ROZ62329.1 ATP-binding cassette domain-containing protein [Kocuria soli]
MGNHAISFREVRKTYPDGTTAVDDLTLDVPEGSLTVFVGPSGCGKTTSLRMINRMVEPTAGTVEVNGQDVSTVPEAQLRRSMGYVMQASGLLPHRTVVENISTVPRLLGQSKRAARERAEELLETIGLDRGLGGRYPSQLSGGQQQRVGVARALAADPPVLLMDEPFSAVDPVVRADLQRELLDLKQRLNKTIVFVTHDMDEAVLLGDRVAVFARGGRLAQYASPEKILREPADQFVSDFVGRDRGFRALSFDTHDIPLSGVLTVDGQGHTAEVGGPAGVTDWVLEVNSAGQPVGWVTSTQSAEITDQAHRVGGSLHHPGGSLRSALDAALSSPSGLAVAVDDDGRLLGVLRPQDVLEAIDKVRESRQ